MDQTSPPFRTLSVFLSSRGFGYAVLEGNDRLVDYGKKIINEDKNAQSLAQIEKFIARYQPDVLVLQDVNAKGSRRAARIKELHRRVVALAKRQRLKVVKISGKELRGRLLGNENGTKQEMAELLAKQFPDELASRLPPKRKPWKSEDARMDIFEAVALTLVFQTKLLPSR
jgi:Holliday junction resolvasome RuvABC endonuclease subunit